MHPLSRSFIVLCLALIPLSGLADDATDRVIDQSDTPDDIKLKFISGFDYSSGFYGDTDPTEVYFVPFTLKAQVNNWTAKLSLPWEKLKLFGTGLDSTEGLGDTSLYLSYTFELTDAFSVEAISKLKIPTADVDKGLGNGAVDKTLALESSETIDDFTFYLGGGYRMNGAQGNYHPRDVFMIDGGITMQFNEHFSGGILYDWRQSPVRASDPSEATFYINYALTKKLKLQPYTVVGFSDGSADEEVGITTSLLLYP